MSCFQDTQVAGKIIIDMTFLRDEGKILPVFPTPDENGMSQGKDITRYIMTCTQFLRIETCGTKPAIPQMRVERCRRQVRSVSLLLFDQVQVRKGNYPSLQSGDEGNLLMM